MQEGPDSDTVREGRFYGRPGIPKKRKQLATKRKLIFQEKKKRRDPKSFLFLFFPERRNG